MSGPGGVGKGTVVARLLEMVPDLQLSRSWTTRARRPGEPEDAYVFVDRPAFEAHLAAGGFLEWNEFPANNALYGTPVIEPGDRDVLLEIELNGARQVKARYPDSLLIFIVAPSRAVQEARLRQRGDDESSVERRLALGEVEQEEGEALADHVVVNDDLERAAAQVAGIIVAHRAGS